MKYVLYVFLFPLDMPDFQWQGIFAKPFLRALMACCPLEEHNDFELVFFFYLEYGLRQVIFKVIVIIIGIIRVARLRDLIIHSQGLVSFSRV